MPFEKFERPPTPEKRKFEELVEDWERIEIESREKLNNSLKEYSFELEKETGVEIKKDNGRINIDWFEGKGDFTSPMVKNAKAYIERKEFEWYGFKKIPEKERKRKSGELLERLATLILHKFLKEDFYVFRTTEYDDYKNHVDHLIIEKKTGYPVCAFDEVTPEAITSERLKEKREKVMERNLKGGANITFGLKPKEGKLIPTSFKNVPIFYLSLTELSLKEAIKNYNPSLEEKSDEEKEVFQHFVRLIQEQTSELLEKDIREYKVKTEDFQDRLEAIETAFLKYLEKE